MMMKNKNNIIYFIIIAILVAIIFLQRSCNSTHINNIIGSKIETKYIHDTFKFENIKYKPKYILRAEHDTIYDSVGNISIIDKNKYITYDTFMYSSDSIKFTLITKIIGDCPLDSIKNSFISNIRHKIIKETITIENKIKNQFYIGPSVGFNHNNGYVSLDLLYERKNNMIYTIGGGINNQGQPMFKMGMYWVLNRK